MATITTRLYYLTISAVTVSVIKRSVKIMKFTILACARNLGLHNYST